MRFERKYRLELLDRSVAEAIIRLHPAGFRRLYPDRQVNNLYFDTPGLEAFRDNVAGVPLRRKFRLRWYGSAAPGPDTLPALEIKSKENQLGSKTVWQLETFQWEDWREEVRSLLRVRLHRLALQPVLVNAYRRSYWGTSNGHFRLTLDWDLRFAGIPGGRSWPKPRWPYHTGGLILELKYASDREQEAQPIFQHLPFRQTKSSKYVTGVNLVYGN